MPLARAPELSASCYSKDRQPDRHQLHLRGCSPGPGSTGKAQEQSPSPSLLSVQAGLSVPSSLPSCGSASTTPGQHRSHGGTVGITPTPAPVVLWLHLHRARLQGAINFCKRHHFWKKAMQQAHERTEKLTPEGPVQVGCCTAPPPWRIPAPSQVGHWSPASTSLQCLGAIMLPPPRAGP